MSELRPTSIQDIVPYIMEHVKTLPLVFESSDMQNCISSCEFVDGCETWFPIMYQDSIDFQGAMDAKVITYITPHAFYGSYSSDEVHRYKVLWFRGEFVAINFMVGDTTHSRTLWMQVGMRAKVISDLVHNFPVSPDVDDEEVYTPETGEAITGSRYLCFIHDGCHVWAMNMEPNYGGLLGNPHMKLLKAMPSEESQMVFEDLGDCRWQRNRNANGCTEHVTTTGDKYTGKRYEYVRIEKVIEMPLIQKGVPNE